MLMRSLATAEPPSGGVVLEVWFSYWQEVKIIYRVRWCRSSQPIGRHKCGDHRAASPLVDTSVVTTDQLPMLLRTRTIVQCLVIPVLVYAFYCCVSLLQQFACPFRTGVQLPCQCTHTYIHGIHHQIGPNLYTLCIFIQWKKFIWIWSSLE